MKHDSTIQNTKINNRLPSLHKSSSKVLFKTNSSNPKLSFEAKPVNCFQQHPKNIDETKAKNFLNQTMTLCSPSVILNLSDCVRKQCGMKFENSKEFSEQNMIKSNFIKQFNPQKQNLPTKSWHLNSLNQSQIFQKDKKGSFERQQILNLAKWIDQKLEQFNSKDKLSIQEIIDYKQHILNYGLGKIIDSVKKRSKEQGELLKILWQNSFKIFQKVLEVVTDSICQKEKSHMTEEQETKQIFDMNLDFLTVQNQKINAQLNNIYEKMKKVIIWNKRLRKQKKNMNILNRILQYRNETYTQALQQTVGMFLKAVPESSTVAFAKKIVSKLAIEKRRKKKPTLQLKEAEQDFQTEAKQLVTSWLRRNGFNEQDDDEIDPLIQLTNDEKLQLTRLDDQTKMNEVDIFQYFKLLDIGVQTDYSTHNAACQYDLDIKPKTIGKGTITDNLYKKNFGIQIGNEVSFKEENIEKQQNKKKNSKIVRSIQKKKSNISKFSQKSDKLMDKYIAKNPSKQSFDNRAIGDDEKGLKFNKNIARTTGKQGSRVYSRKEQDKESSIYNSNRNTSSNYFNDDERDNRFYEKDFTVISEKKSEEFNFQSDEEVKNWTSDKYRVSISKLNGESKANRYETSKCQQYETIKGRQASIKDFTQYGINEDQNQSDHKGANNMKQLWRYIQNKKINNKNERDERLSMNFIKIDSENYSMKKLERKSFNQFYEEGKINARSKEKQRQKLFQTVVRRRSFYKKGKVMFENSNDFEQSKQTNINLYKSYIHYKPHKNKAIIQISTEEQEKVDHISKKMAIPSNLAKSKTLAVSKEMFKQLSEACKKTKKQPPKNKQYFNNSLVSITKNVNALVQDYIRQIKRQKDQIQNDFQKTYYPLHTILMDKMNWKYGLKDISEKKIKDFLQKILTFAPVSEKISLYSLLFGMEIEGVGADELLIYLKCLVYLEKKQPITSSIHIVKESNPFEKVSTEHEVVEENIDRILKDFFDKEGIELVRSEVFKYLEENSKFLNIEKISEIIIKSLLKRKLQFKNDALFLYKLCSRGKNIFTNLYKILKLFNNYSRIQSDEKIEQNSIKYRNGIKKIGINVQNMLREFIKRSDVIDEIYGKSISFDRFLTAYMVTELPKAQQFTKTFDSILGILNSKSNQLNVLKSNESQTPRLNITIYSQETVKLLDEIQKKWQIKGSQKPDEENWKWSVSKTVTDHVENNLKSIVGKLDIFHNQIDNFFFSQENKAQPSKE